MGMSLLGSIPIFAAGTAEVRCLDAALSQWWSLGRAGSEGIFTSCFPAGL